MVGNDTTSGNNRYLYNSFQDNTEEHKLIGKEVEYQRGTKQEYRCAARKAGKPSQALS